MKVKFRSCEQLAQNCQSEHRHEKRSQAAGGFAAKKLRINENHLTKACHGANSLKLVEKDMEEWAGVALQDSHAVQAADGFVPTRS
jgi:hypothetical protein